MSQTLIENKGNGKFAVKGILSFYTVPQLRQEGIAQFSQHSKLSIELKDVSYSDSSGLALLFEWLRYARTKKKYIEFHSMPEQMQAIANVTGLAAILRSGGNTVAE